MAVDIETLEGASAGEIAALFTASFAAYPVPIAVSPSDIDRMIKQDGVDLRSSLVAREGELAVGLLLLARRSTASRIAAMGLLPTTRGRGIGGRLLEMALAGARRHGDRRIHLECIESNERALKLYRRMGFVVRRRLLGFSLDCERALSNTVDPSIATPLGIRDIGRAMRGDRALDLPWQIAPERWCDDSGSDAHGLICGDARAVISFATASGESERETTDAAPRVASGARAIADSAADEMGDGVLRLLWVPPSSRRRGHGRRLIQALLRAHPRRRWTVPALVPEASAPALEALGFRRRSLSQVDMQLTLDRTGRAEVGLAAD